MALTLEGQIVRVADSIAYLNHDLDDALRARVISRRQVLDEVELTARGRSGSVCGVCGAVSTYPLNYCPACSEFNSFKN